jgi:hypothetical protein
MIVALVAVAVVVLAGMAVATVSVEPLRGNFWEARGHQCGSVATRIEMVRPPANYWTTIEQCLQEAAQRCQAASLAYSRRGLDTQSTITLVVEPAVPVIAPRDVVAVWVNNVDAGLSRRSGVERCAGVDMESDGLHARACGQWGSFVVPSG